jgi:hypothetical protein
MPGPFVRGVITAVARCAAAWLLCPTLATAQIQVVIANPSFESPAIAPEPYGPAGHPVVTGWAILPSPGYSGVYHAMPPQVPVVPDGAQVAFAGIHGSLTQTLSTNATSNTFYSLRVKVGRRADASNIQTNNKACLLIGGVEVSCDGVPAPVGYFTELEVTYTTLALPAGPLPLGIRLSSDVAEGSQELFDNVRLTATPLGIPIANPSFESPAIALEPFGPAGYPAVSGWAISAPGYAGPYHSTSGAVPVVPDGAQVAFAGLGGWLAQTLATNATSNTSYSLRVKVGRRADSSNAQTNNKACLLIGGIDVKCGSAPAPVGSFAELEVTYTTQNVLPGLPLGIRLSSDVPSGSQELFDNVRLTAMPLDVGTITVTTNRPDATFTVAGSPPIVPSGYHGTGVSWTEPDAPAGLVYSIVYGPVQGFLTPYPQRQGLAAGGTMTFDGDYRNGCGIAELDALINEYATYNILLAVPGQAARAPDCADATTSFTNLRTPSDYSRGLVREPLVVPFEAGYGLNAWFFYVGERTITSGYRNPAKNFRLETPGAVRSRHMQGDAVDVQNVTHTEQEHNDLSIAALWTEASYIEPLELGGYEHVHADWREVAGGLQP